MSSNKFIQDGEAQVKEAEKSLKTGLMKWSQDFDVAAGCYTKAATSFKNAKEYARSLDCSMKAADCHLKNKVPFQAAKSLEQAAFCARDLGDFKKVVELINRAYLLYVENGVQDTAGTLLDRGAKILEDPLPQEASNLYRKAGDLAQIQDKNSQASEMFDKSARLLVKMDKYDEAAKVLEELIKNELASPSPPARRFVLCLVLVHLKRDDYVAARKAYETGLRFPDPLNSGQLDLARSLLDSYDHSDREALKQVTSNAFVRSLDPVYARLARSLDVADGGLGAVSAAPVAVARPSPPQQQQQPAFIPQEALPQPAPVVASETPSPADDNQSASNTEFHVTSEDNEDDLT
ncbi:gamma-soluble NSF attachment protein-like [Paramacrobiotus metropolitanus]|uniref:gamma-soluble NSF attachment protein-like n=1 Tax=Paramacrobiotus metropolitanus TaxID=2943436 RepID=UPI002445F7C7|nr:gamma-soluble NSF attachment protein-like [Paramacrobiotus metropolitanus]